MPTMGALNKIDECVDGRVCTLRSVGLFHAYPVRCQLHLLCGIDPTIDPQNSPLVSYNGMFSVVNGAWFKFSEHFCVDSVQ